MGSFFLVYGALWKRGAKDESPALLATALLVWQWYTGLLWKVHFIDQRFVITRSERAWSCWVERWGVRGKKGAGLNGTHNSNWVATTLTCLGCQITEAAVLFAPHALCWPFQSSFSSKPL